MRSISGAALVAVIAVATGCKAGSAPPSASSGRGAPGATFTLAVTGETPYFDAATATTLQLPAGGLVTATGISCGITGGVAYVACSSSFRWGDPTAPTIVTVTATPDAGAGYAFHAFAGACSGNDACQVRGNSDTFVAVRFARTIEGLRAHPNLSDPAVHGAAYRDFAAGVPGAWPCTSCHGPDLQGQGIALSCAACHPWPRPAGAALVWGQGRWNETVWQ